MQENKDNRIKEKIHSSNLFWVPIIYKVQQSCRGCKTEQYWVMVSTLIHEYK